MYTSPLVVLLSLVSAVHAQSSDASSAGATPTSSQNGAGSAPTSSFSVDPNLPQTPLTMVAGQTIPNLAELTSGAPVQSGVPLATTYSQGIQPSVSRAPALPNPTLTVSNYPALDLTPPTDSPEVQEWLSKIDMSKVPNYSQTDGTCAGSPGAISDGRCWWTCGGCTRSSDITICPDKMTWGVSYDDGPSPYTPLLLDYLAAVNISTTFFVVGSRVISRPEMLQAEYIQGHQISVHTWSHSSMTTLTNEQIVAELGWTMKAIRDVIGVTPNTWRPPYGDIDDRVRAIAAQMGLTAVMWSAITENGVTTDFDTDDWRIPGGAANGPSSLSKFNTILDTYVPSLSTGFIVLQHDIYQQTVDLAVGYVMPMAIQSGKFTFKSIINCLGYPNSEAYIETSSNTTQTAITSAASTFYQASIGSATGAAVTASGVSASGSAGPSSASGSSSASTSGAATRSANLGLPGLAPVVVSLLALGLGAVIIA
ncbi:hypothetical protein BD324DRAFT_619382 [Kockovaella imperatae]|uniref:chitin deacetylase n=1 Tax=Kockovaella imperatae TaxID=4999 RepID=A0A1Y1UMS9_9TREE|nr:hypothetical protein BD324DRAFT_619382 [Kockovaella imperatae]ORX39358.1 hypothetical protein BD324DRAFT_619382 [Kockovaella imperatae]